MGATPLSDLSEHPDRKVLGDQGLGHLEGKIRGALTSADVESIVVPAGTAAESIRRLRSAGIAVEVRPRERQLGPSGLMASLKSWLFVSPSEILNQEARTVVTATKVSAPAQHLTPSQRRRSVLAQA